MDNNSGPNEDFPHQLKNSLLSGEIRTLALFVAIFIGAGTGFYSIVESWRILDAFYFSVMTLTTVGYGDLSPTSDLSKLFTVFLTIGGLGLMLTFLQAIARQQAREPFFFRLINRNRKKNNN